jgi:hypothetical protein
MTDKVNVNKEEALLDAIANLNDAYKPESRAYILKNPIMLRSFAAPGKHAVTEEGYRIFTSHLSGYKSASYDLHLKLEGQSNCGLKPTDKLKNLLAVYGIQDEQAQMAVVFFLRKALDKNIDLTTPLSYFTENK